MLFMDGQYNKNDKLIKINIQVNKNYYHIKRSIIMVIGYMLNINKY